MFNPSSIKRGAIKSLGDKDVSATRLRMEGPVRRMRGRFTKFIIMADV
jgi:hypothetical protein